MTLDLLLPIWWLTIVQILGLVSAWLARVNQGSRFQDWYHRAFMTLLAMVGGTTLLAATFCPDLCVLTGTTLAVMVIMAVCDFDKGKKVLAR